MSGSSKKRRWADQHPAHNRIRRIEKFHSHLREESALHLRRRRHFIERGGNGFACRNQVRKQSLVDLRLTSIFHAIAYVVAFRKDAPYRSAQTEGMGHHLKNYVSIRRAILKAAQGSETQRDPISHLARQRADELVRSALDSDDCTYWYAQGSTADEGQLLLLLERAFMTHPLAADPEAFTP